MLKLVQLNKWDGENPTQWSGETVEGRKVYIRYRWGTLNVDLEDPLEELLSLDYGGEYSGDMETERMLELTGIEVVEDGKDQLGNIEKGIMERLHRGGVALQGPIDEQGRCELVYEANDARIAYVTQYVMETLSEKDYIEKENDVGYLTFWGLTAKAVDKFFHPDRKCPFLNLKERDWRELPDDLVLEGKWSCQESPNSSYYGRLVIVHEVSPDTTEFYPLPRFFEKMVGDASTRAVGRLQKDLRNLLGAASNTPHRCSCR